ncbi:hypothetical protein P0Y35_08570 [Kiritimatiellaeota bacterium B1221]|nr:hypothetical protein [Kiritimatiellaeota bacterium B1221]
MNEEIRKTVLEYLALRPTGAFELSQITRMINMRGMLDIELEEKQVDEALVFLLGMDFVSVQHGGLGSSKHWQVTSPGILYHERGE